MFGKEPPQVVEVQRSVRPGPDMQCTSAASPREIVGVVLEDRRQHDRVILAWAMSGRAC